MARIDRVGRTLRKTAKKGPTKDPDYLIGGLNREESRAMGYTSGSLSARARQEENARNLGIKAEKMAIKERKLEELNSYVKSQISYDIPNITRTKRSGYTVLDSNKPIQAQPKSISERLAEERAASKGVPKEVTEEALKRRAKQEELGKQYSSTKDMRSAPKKVKDHFKNNWGKYTAGGVVGIGGIGAYAMSGPDLSGTMSETSLEDRLEYYRRMRSGQ